MADFNAYIHARPDGRVFYVGKGSAKRSLEMFRSRNAHHTNVVNKHGAENILVGRLPCSSDAISLQLEIGLIKCFRRMGVELANLTDGGEGTRGAIKPPEERAAIAARIANFWSDPERKAATSKKISDAYANPSLRKHMSVVMKGNTSRTGRKNSPEHNEALRKANLGKTMSEESRLKMSVASTGRTMSDETKLKMSIAHKKIWAERKLKKEHANG